MDYNISMTLSGHPSTPSNYVLNGKIMLSSVITLFLVIAILVGIHTYTRCLSNRRRRRRRLLHHGTAHSLLFLASTTTSSNNNSVTNQALDVSILKTIPTFVYSSTTDHEQVLECAVCVSEFEDNEEGRVLPKCNHAFHVDCIDMWFQSHSNCPLCRAPVEEAVQVTDQPACSGGEREEAEPGCSSRSLPPLEWVGVVVEVPRGNFRGLDDTGLVSPEGSGFKSPGNRVLSLKRLWSV